MTVNHGQLMVLWGRLAKNISKKGLVNIYMHINANVCLHILHMSRRYLCICIASWWCNWWHSEVKLAKCMPKASTQYWCISLPIETPGFQNMQIPIDIQIGRTALREMMGFDTFTRNNTYSAWDWRMHLRSCEDFTVHPPSMIIAWPTLGKNHPCSTASSIFQCPWLTGGSARFWTFMVLSPGTEPMVSLQVGHTASSPSRLHFFSATTFQLICANHMREVSAATAVRKHLPPSLFEAQV